MKYPGNPAIDLKSIVVRPVEGEAEKSEAREFLAFHHYLKDIKAVGEQIWYGVFDAQGQWLGVLVFCAASRRLHARDTWIGWSEEQRRRRLALVVNNARFLLLPHKTVPNLASCTLRLALDRLSADWQLRYGHPVTLVETFFDPEHYCGTTYTVSGWRELGRTEGHGRVRRDFYTEHGRPKRLFAKELFPGARRGLAAEVLKPSLAAVEARVAPRPTRNSREIRLIIGHFKNLPDYRARIGRYPLWSLLAIVFMAHLFTAVTSQSQFYLGSALVPAEKTNEIPVARALFEKLDLDGRLVSLDALHT
jgi:hypothetical protein